MSSVERTSLLQVERNILQFDIDIKTSLQLTAADPAKCIIVLEQYNSNVLHIFCTWIAFSI